MAAWFLFQLDRVRHPDLYYNCALEFLLITYMYLLRLMWLLF